MSGMIGTDYLAYYALKSNTAKNYRQDNVEFTEKLLGEIATKKQQGIGTDQVAETAPVSLEDRLKAKYPGLVYHVFDASSSYWKTRNDYPHYLLYQENADVEALENWKPTGPNPAYGASKEIKKLGSIVAQKAVVIHPKVQERMEQDPAYADEIMARIDAWFAFDVARNEAILPGCTVGMSQCVAIGEDGNIVNACSSGPGRITQSTSGGDEDDPGFWELRRRRHKFYMELWQEKQMEHRHQISSQMASIGNAEMARRRLAQMLQDGDLKKALGDTIGGVPTEEIFALTAKEVWG